MTTIVAATTEIDSLRAENSALRHELEALQQTHVGEVVAHNDELFRENARLRAEVERLKR